MSGEVACNWLGSGGFLESPDPIDGLGSLASTALGFAGGGGGGGGGVPLDS